MSTYLHVTDALITSQYNHCYPTYTYILIKTLINWTHPHLADTFQSCEHIHVLAMQVACGHINIVLHIPSWITRSSYTFILWNIHMLRFTFTCTDIFIHLWNFRRWYTHSCINNIFIHYFHINSGSIQNIHNTFQ